VLGRAQAPRDAFGRDATVGGWNGASHTLGGRTVADGMGIGSDSSPCISVWEWSNRFHLMQRVDCPPQRCFWRQEDPGVGPSGSRAFPRCWPRRLHLSPARVPSCVVMTAQHSLTWWHFQLDTLSQAWRLRLGATFRLTRGSVVDTARDHGTSGYAYAITQDPASAICFNHSGHVMAKFHTAFDSVKRLQVGQSDGVHTRHLGAA